MAISEPPLEPWPHAVLLVLPANTSFTERSLTALQQHLELLGENAWRHVVLLFTYGDWLGSTPVEQFIESEGDALQMLVEQCGNRYHVFNNKKRSNRMQVTELLEKIEEMVQENRGRHFEMDEKKLNEVKEKWRISVEEGEKRRRRRLFKGPPVSVDSGINSLCNSSEFIRPALQLVLMGYRRAGQTSSANTILGRKEFGYSCLSLCVKREAKVADRSVSVICTPGWGKTERCCNTLDQNQEIVRSVDLCSSGPVVFLLVLRASMSFCAETLKAMEERVELLGGGVWDHTMLLFTYGDRLGDATIEQHIETEGEALKTLVERCGNRYHVLDNSKKVGRSQVISLLVKTEEMVQGNGCRCFQVSRERLLEAKERWKTEGNGCRCFQVSRERLLEAKERWKTEGNVTEGCGEDQDLEEIMDRIERSWSFSN